MDKSEVSALPKKYQEEFLIFEKMTNRIKIKDITEKKRKRKSESSADWWQVTLMNRFN